MKKLKMMVLLIALGAMQTFAQGPRHGHHPGMRGEMHMMKNLDSLVDLTDDQQVQIESIQKEQKEKMKALRTDDARPDKETMMKLHKETQTKIMAVLTNDQKEILKQKREEHKDKMKEMRDEMKTYRETNIKSTLTNLRAVFDEQLSEEEKAKIEEVRIKSREMRATLKEKCKDSLCEKDQSGVKREKCKAMHDGRKAIHSYVQTELQPIVDAHKAELDKIQTDLQPLRETWKAEMKGIKDKYVPQQNMDEHTGHGHKKGHQRRNAHGKSKKGSTKSMDQADHEQIRFLLFDGSEDLPEAPEDHPRD